MNKIGMVGLGSIGKKHVANLRKLYPSCQILVCSSSGVSYQHSHEYLIRENPEVIAAEDPDAVIIASPAPYHSGHAAIFQKKNIPVLVEKPLASSLDEIFSSGITDNRLAVAYCLRYLPAARLLKSVIASGEYGKIYNIDACVGQYLPDWRKDKDYRNSVSASGALGGGALLELSHEFDMLNYLSGDLAFEYAHLRKNQELELEVEEIADVILTSRREILCRVHLDFIQKKPSRSIKIIAQHANIEWDIIGNRVVAKTADEVRVIYDVPDYEKNNMYLDMLKDFENLVCGRENDCVTLDEAVQVVRLIEEIKRKGTWSS